MQQGALSLSHQIKPVALLDKSGKMFLVCAPFLCRGFLLSMSVNTRDAVRMVLLYGLASVVWLGMCDYLLRYLIEDPARLARGQLMSGYVWMAISAVFILLARTRLLLYMGVSCDHRREEDQRKLRLAAGCSHPLDLALLAETALPVFMAKCYLAISAFLNSIFKNNRVSLRLPHATSRPLLLALRATYQGARS